MQPSRILLVGLPRMLRDLITNIVNDQGDIRIVGHLRSDGVSLRDLERTEPDMIIVGLRDSKIPDVCKTLVERHAATKVVGLYGEGRRGILYELKPHAVMLGEVSRQMLLEIMREVSAS